MGFEQGDANVTGGLSSAPSNQKEWRELIARVMQVATAKRGDTSGVLAVLHAITTNTHISLGGFRNAALEVARKQTTTTEGNTAEVMSLAEVVAALTSHQQAVRARELAEKALDEHQDQGGTTAEGRQQLRELKTAVTQTLGKEAAAMTQRLQAEEDKATRLALIQERVKRHGGVVGAEQWLQEVSSQLFFIMVAQITDGGYITTLPWYRAKDGIGCLYHYWEMAREPPEQVREESRRVVKMPWDEGASFRQNVTAKFTAASTCERAGGERLPADVFFNAVSQTMPARLQNITFDALEKTGFLAQDRWEDHVLAVVEYVERYQSVMIGDAKKNRPMMQGEWEKKLDRVRRAEPAAHVNLAASDGQTQAKAQQPNVRCHNCGEWGHFYYNRNVCKKPLSTFLQGKCDAFDEEKRRQAQERQQHRGQRQGAGKANSGDGDETKGARVQQQVAKLRKDFNALMASMKTSPKTQPKGYLCVPNEKGGTQLSQRDGTGAVLPPGLVEREIHTKDEWEIQGPPGRQKQRREEKTRHNRPHSWKSKHKQEWGATKRRGSRRRHQGGSRKAGHNGGRLGGKDKPRPQQGAVTLGSDRDLPRSTVRTAGQQGRYAKEGSAWTDQVGGTWTKMTHGTTRGWRSSSGGWGRREMHAQAQMLTVPADHQPTTQALRAMTEIHQRILDTGASMTILNGADHKLKQHFQAEQGRNNPDICAFGNGRVRTEARGRIPNVGDTLVVSGPDSGYTTLFATSEILATKQLHGDEYSIIQGVDSMVAVKTEEVRGATAKGVRISELQSDGLHHTTPGFYEWLQLQDRAQRTPDPAIHAFATVAQTKSVMEMIMHKPAWSVQRMVKAAPYLRFQTRRGQHSITKEMIYNTMKRLGGIRPGSYEGHNRHPVRVNDEEEAEPPIGTVAFWDCATFSSLDREGYTQGEVLTDQTTGMVFYSIRKDKDTSSVKRTLGLLIQAMNRANGWGNKLQTIIADEESALIAIKAEVEAEYDLQIRIVPKDAKALNGRAESVIGHIQKGMRKIFTAQPPLMEDGRVRENYRFLGRCFTYVCRDHNYMVMKGRERPRAAEFMDKEYLVMDTYSLAPFMSLAAWTMPRTGTGSTRSKYVSNVQWVLVLGKDNSAKGGLLVWNPNRTQEHQQVHHVFQVRLYSDRDTWARFPLDRIRAGESPLRTDIVGTEMGARGEDKEEDETADGGSPEELDEERGDMKGEEMTEDDIGSVREGALAVTQFLVPAGKRTYVGEITTSAWGKTTIRYFGWPDQPMTKTTEEAAMEIINDKLDVVNELGTGRGSHTVKRLQTGQVVAKRFENYNGIYLGKIGSIEGDDVHVTYMDGDQEDITRAEAMEIALPIQYKVAPKGTYVVGAFSATVAPDQWTPGKRQLLRHRLDLMHERGEVVTQEMARKVMGQVQALIEKRLQGTEATHEAVGFIVRTALPPDAQDGEGLLGQAFTSTSYLLRNTFKDRHEATKKGVQLRMRRQEQREGVQLLDMELVDATWPPSTRVQRAEIAKLQQLRSEEVPKFETVSDGLADEKWGVAVHEGVRTEMINFARFHALGYVTADITEREAKKLTGFKFVVAHKTETRYGVKYFAKFKVRGVVQGFHMEKWEYDSDQTSSPVAAKESMRVIISWSVREDKLVAHVDHKSAFLQTPLREGQHLRSNPLLRMAFGPEAHAVTSYVAGYGRPDASRKFSDLVGTVISSIEGVRQGRIDTCTFVSNEETPETKVEAGKRREIQNILDEFNKQARRMGVIRKDLELPRQEYRGDVKAMVAQHVDDGLWAADIDELTRLILCLGEEFVLGSVTPLEEFAGTEVTRTEEGLMLAKNAYINKLAGQYRQRECNPMSHPSGGLKYVKEHLRSQSIEDTLKVVGLPYRNLLMSLSYAGDIFPECRYYLRRLAYAQNDPSMAAWRHVIRLLQYMYTRVREGNAGIEYRRRPELGACPVVVFVDAAHAAGDDGRYSGLAYAVYSYGHLIKFKAMRDTVISTSTTHAELRALIKGIQSAMTLAYQLEEMNGTPRIPILVLCDCRPLVLRMNGGAFTKTDNKHRDLDNGYAQERVKTGDMVIKHIPGKDQLADMGTKWLEMKRFSRLRDIALGKASMPRSVVQRVEDFMANYGPMADVDVGF